MKIQDIKVGDTLIYRGRDLGGLYWGQNCVVVALEAFDNVVVQPHGRDERPEPVSTNAANLVPLGTPYVG